MHVFALVLILSVILIPVCCAQNADPNDEDVQIASSFVSQLARDDFGTAAAAFNDGLKAALPADKLKGVWSQLAAQYGPFKRQSGSRTSVEQGYEVVFVTCQFQQTVLETKLMFDDKGKVGGLWFLTTQSNATYVVPDYVKQGSYFEQQVTVGSGEWALPATITIPNGKGPFPAVVLVQGSGPLDRDETVGPNKPFKDLALGLASNGIIVLRYEKRTKQYPQKIDAISESMTVKEETTDDAIAAIAVLKKTPDVDQKHVFVLGHSLGGMLLPRIARAEPEIAGLIVMSGTTRPLEDVILDQSTYLFSLNQTPTESDKQALDLIKAQVKRVKAPELSDKIGSTMLPFGIPASYWLDLRNYDPALTAKAIKKPMLILQGARDYQVTSVDFDGWKNALSARTDVTFRMYNTLNHLFMEGEGKSVPAEYQVPGHVSSAVISDIAVWISGH